ncbi:glycosyltransferase family 2 protein [Ulvibacter litoralis]|uniref:Glycosyl transferase family 2 n=1 Tax=Ulvibacter litoralis TaxID=227084 RepID=A0A1G7C2R2_9FLAO|nr:glycosyltransferase family 2 protein [Ulvibacter litoralis]GHC49066.1 glycosyl transferase family 2 [Ulvibacter litoralis]SDE32966.1 Glycosyl transferase family 2 [Ulvibacter litoralis]
MKIYIVIPAYNEEASITRTLQSLAKQSFLPEKILVVNDNSTDNTQKCIDAVAEKYPFIHSVSFSSEAIHQPGSKVINAFNKGLETLDTNYDIICKFDADLIFPENYLQRIAALFKENPTCGMAGGFCYIEKKGEWVLENLTNKDHIRGALKAYRKACFNQMNGLKNTMGWDTIDELLAQYHGWSVKTDPTLHVKHLKPTGASYSKGAKFKQGEAFYKMRYGKILTHIAAAKLAFRKKSFTYYLNCIKGYHKAKKSNAAFVVSEEEGHFIRTLRWKGIKRKFL